MLCRTHKTSPFSPKLENPHKVKLYICSPWIQTPILLSPMGKKVNCYGRMVNVPQQCHTFFKFFIHNHFWRQFSFLGRIWRHYKKKNPKFLVLLRLFFSLSSNVLIQLHMIGRSLQLQSPIKAWIFKDLKVKHKYAISILFLLRVWWHDTLDNKNKRVLKIPKEWK